MDTKILHIYRVSYRRADNLARVYRLTVRARNADEAREYAKLRDPQFGSTVASPRKGREVSPPESSDGITQAKYRDELNEGNAYFDDLYGTSCNEPDHVDGCAGRVGGDHEFRDEWVQDHGGYVLVIDGSD